MISITKVGYHLPSKKGATRFPVPEGSLDKARTAADVLAVVQAHAKVAVEEKSEKETYGEAIKRAAEGGSKHVESEKA